MSLGEPLTVDRCFPTQDGVWRALCRPKAGLVPTLNVPCELPEGATIYARRFGEQWALVEPIHIPRSGP